MLYLNTEKSLTYILNWAMSTQTPIVQDQFNISVRQWELFQGARFDLIPRVTQKDSYSIRRSTSGTRRSNRPVTMYRNSSRATVRSFLLRFAAGAVASIVVTIAPVVSVKPAVVASVTWQCDRQKRLAVSIDSTTPEAEIAFGHPST